ncbi:MAG: cobalamin biosynthesis protein CobW, partial [Pseudomonadota bacterium]
TMEKLLERDDRPDHIIIETSGLALPQPLVAAFNWPEVKTQVTVDGVVTVVDAAAVSEGRFAHDHDKLDAQRVADEELDHESPLEELFEDQIRAADMIVLNKSDLVNAEKLEAVKANVQSQTKRALKMVRAERGNLPISVLLGLGSATEDEIINRKSHHEMHHADGHTHDHDHDEFESFVVEAGEVENSESFVENLKAIIAANDILRLKGFCSVPGKPMRLVVQAVGQRIETYYDRAWAEGETRNSRLVVIGLHDLDQVAIAQAIKTAV